MIHRETALIKPNSAYTYYKVKKQVSLFRRGKETVLKPGTTVGLRDAGSKPGAKRLIVGETGATIIYTVARESVESLMKVLQKSR